MSKTKVKEDIYALPIDQYSRQMWASKIIDELRNDNKKLKILDVGGYKGKTSVFQSNDEVVICDLFDVKEKGYIKGDGKTLPFKDKEFDFALTFDTYEHVPRKIREKFISELIRVSGIGVVLAAPFDNDKRTVSNSEIDLNDLNKSLYDKDHIWLKEHIDYGIPFRKELEELLNKYEKNYTKLSSNDLSVWIVMQSLYFSIDIDEEMRGRVDYLNRIYNKGIDLYDLSYEDNAYRQIYFFSRNAKYVETIRKFIEKHYNKSGSVNTTKFIAEAMKVWAIKYRDVQNHRKYLDNFVEELVAESISLYKRKNINSLSKQARDRLLSLEGVRDYIKEHKS